jgi:hypothetical protein
MASSWVASIMEILKERPEDMQFFEKIDSTMEALKPLSLSLDLWKAQNIYFSISRNFLNTMKQRAEDGDPKAQRWMEGFLRLGHYLHVKV